MGKQDDGLKVSAGVGLQLWQAQGAHCLSSAEFHMLQP